MLTLISHVLCPYVQRAVISLHRAWIEFGSAVLNDIAGFYSAADETAFAQKIKALTDKFARLEARLGAGPYFDGERFSLVDVVFGPVFPLLRCF